MPDDNDRHGTDPTAAEGGDLAADGPRVPADPPPQTLPPPLHQSDLRSSDLRAPADPETTQVVDHGAGWAASPPRIGGQPPAGDTEVLQTGIPMSLRRHGRFGVAWIAGGAALALVAAGGVYAYTLLSGGGSQPEEHIPADAIMFLKVDLDPAAGQKVAAMRFLQHFPDAADVLGDEEDIRKIIFELAQEDNEALSSLDYESDIEPWLGDRVGVAAIPSEVDGGEPETLIVLQVRDEDRAADGLRELYEATDSPEPGVVFAGDYAILAEDEEVAERAHASATEANLGDDETFRADMDGFGDGVGAFWMDLERVGDLAAELDPTVAATSPDLQGLFDDVYSGRIAGVLSFDDDYADLTIRGVGASGFGLPATPGESVSPLLATLPSDTLVALAYTGLDDSVASGWESFMGTLASAPEGADIEAAIAQLEADYGIRLPDDLRTLLGSQTLVVLAGNTLVSAPPTIAYRAETDVSAASDLMQRIEELAAQQGVQLPLVWETEGSTLLVGASPADLSAIQSGTGIADPAARTALTNLEGAQQALWIDLDELSDIIIEEFGGTPDDTLTHIAGIGLTASAGTDGSWTATVRVVAD